MTPTLYSHRKTHQLTHLSQQSVHQLGMSIVIHAEVDEHQVGRVLLDVNAENGVWEKER
jgi:hypothetical protein